MANKIITDGLKNLIQQVEYDLNNSKTPQDKTKHGFRLRQIKNGLKMIDKITFKIKSGKDLEDVPGIGKGLMTRIDEILKTGKLKEITLDKTKKDYLNKLAELETVIGIGKKKAKELYDKYGITSVKELKEAHKNEDIDLPEEIITGLKLYGKYKGDIPRKEVEKIEKYLQNKLKEMDKNFKGLVCGSYRRGKKILQDIDFLIVNKNVKTDKDLTNLKENTLKDFIKLLKDDKFLIANLTYKDIKSKYMGFCKFEKNPIRRIDIRFVPYESYPTALLYFTGSGNLNKLMRQVAKDQDYKLNEYGLFKGKRRIEIKTEEEVFKILGMDYLPPEDRE